MTLQQLTAADIASWNSLQDIASSFEKRGLRPKSDLGDDDELVLQLTDTEFIVLVEAGPGETASDYKPDNRRRRTNLVATSDYEEFTFLTRTRSWEGQQHGRIKHQKLSFTKEQMTSERGEKNTVLQKLNTLEYGSAAAIRDSLYDTKQVVEAFYEEYESLRTDLVEEVSGIPDEHDDSKQRYVQVILDRMIFLYFIQEKRLLNREYDYLSEKHSKFSEEGDVYTDFYEPLFFEMLAEGKQAHEGFGELPYLNGGLFSKNPVEVEFEEARLGETSERTDELFARILDFLSDWNWNVDERLDIVDPKNLSPAILGHIFEQTVNQKEMGAYYTPEEVTGFMARQTIHPYLLEQLNEAVDGEYEEIDEVFGFSTIDAEGGAEAIADGGAVTAQMPTENVQTRHVEALYHDILTEMRVLDPAVGSGAFLLAAQDVLFDIYLQCIEFFQQVDAEGKSWELENRTREELQIIEERSGKTSLYAKRNIILNNLYGVDIDDGATDICKLRLWLSMVADIEDEPSEVDPLPNIDFNIRAGDSLIGFESTEVAIDGQQLLITEFLKDELTEYKQRISEYKSAEESLPQLRGQLDTLHDEMQEQLDEWFVNVPDITVEEDISSPDEINDLIAAADGDIKLKLKFADPIQEKLEDELKELGFRTWKTAANLEMGNNDSLAGTPERIFEITADVEVTRSFVERGLLKRDIEEANPFHWVMEFPEVYSGEEDGFDILLENPPYVRIESVDELKKDIYKNLHETAVASCDLYVPFIERSYELLSEAGRTSIVTSNLFMRTEYGEALREYLPQNHGIEELYDFTAYSVFDDVTIYTTILCGTKDTNSAINCVSVRSEDAVDKIRSTDFSWEPSEDIVEFTLTPETLGADRWLILTDEERGARQKVVEASDTTLEDEKRFTVGSPLKTGQNTTLEADIVGETDTHYDIENSRISGRVKSGIWKRIINSDYVNRWNVSTPMEVTFFPYTTTSDEYELIDEDTFSSEYPDTYEMLSEYKDMLLERKDSRKTWRQLGRPWYSLARYGGPEYFEETKIVTDIVINEPHFCIDTEGYLFSTGYIHGITPHGTDPYYLTGILNTDAIFAYLKPICPPKNSGYLKMEVDQLKQAPVYLPTIDEELCETISERLDRFEGQFGELSQTIDSEGLDSIIDVDMSHKTIAANVIREVSKYITEEYNHLTEMQIEELENVNNQMAGIIFGLNDTELQSLSQI